MPTYILKRADDSEESILCDGIDISQGMHLVFLNRIPSGMEIALAVHTGQWKEVKKSNLVLAKGSDAQN